MAFDPKTVVKNPSGGYTYTGLGDEFGTSASLKAMKELGLEEEEFKGSDKFLRLDYNFQIDFQKLAEDFKSGYLERNVYDYKRYLSKKSHKVSDIAGQYELEVFDPVQLSTVDENRNLGETVFEGKLNLAVNHIHIPPSFHVHIDLSKSLIEYRIYFQYAAGYKYQRRGRSVEFGFEETSVNSLFNAIVLTTERLEDIKSFLIQAGFANWPKLEKYISARFNTEMNKAKGENLAFLYERCPNVTIIDRDPKVVFADFYQLVQLDASSIIVDTGLAVLKTMMAYQYSNYFYVYLNRNQTLVKQAYNLLNGDVKVGNTIVSRRTYFATQLYLGLLSDEKKKILDKTFYLIDDKYSVDSHVKEGSDSEEPQDIGKIYLHQYSTVSIGAPPPPGEEQKEAVVDYADSGAYYNPLDMVYLVTMDETSKPFLVPAIYVKTLADDNEWKRIKFTVEVLTDVAMIVLSVAALSTGNAPASVYILSGLSLVEATVDLSMLAFIPDSDPAKQYYIDNWRKINLFIQAPFAIHMAKDILLHGPRMLKWISEASSVVKWEIRNVVISSITTALMEVEATNLVKGTLRVIPPTAEFYNLPNYIKNPEKYYEIGAFFVEGELAVISGVTNDGIGIVYEGHLIAFDSERNLQKFFANLNKLEGAEFFRELVLLEQAVGKVPIGGTKLSNLAIEFRFKTIEAEYRFDGNAATFAFERNGKIETKVFTTLKKEEYRALGFQSRPHSEEIGFKWLKDNGITKDKLIAVYSENEPCVLKGYRCKHVLNKQYGSAKVSYSYDFPDDPIICAESMRQKSIDLEIIYNSRK